ncbi:phd finger domain-containing protein [Purpureocillium lilacinum]|uniref:Phd finger domain-containing protein n=1 Tax=Purpureocillium lilacinum TaxID=33203 RepID=A0A179GVT4_PURLI|nr:phd finger domain-containing protein [Purpureocillium lilacinum]OAQ81420.1 phd finger domain-containing protein [Purpureocillium lilacinum]OAQ91475.1 phd finger domain-containing protein [Purpureocillium lilacinum]
MPSRKRSLQSVDGDAGDTDHPAGAELLDRIRNMWQFANVCQWIYIFGKVAKIDDSVDVEEMEAECLKPQSTLLADVALSILKLVSSHRGLTHDIFNDQMRKQYLAKSPDSNPFGDEDAPRNFADLDVFTKIKVLQQLTQWVMIHPERLRDKMEEQKDTEQAGWRIEPYGWDRDDRTYFVLDDNRIYRMTEPPPVLPRPKAKKSKIYRAGRRSSKRQRISSPQAAESTPEGEAGAEPSDDSLGGNIWECVAVTLQEVRAFLESLGKTRDENERILRRQLQLHLVPILEKQEEAQKRKHLQRERELLNLAKMANAKRSSRIAGKAERQRQEEHEREEEQQRREVEAARRREERERQKMEKERDFRMFSRQRRLQEREARRLQHEEELAQLSEDSRNTTTAPGRTSERRLLVEIEKSKQALRELEEEEEAWVFDCVCGLYGQVDDGTHSVACERCNVWQHSKCLGISEDDADRAEFHFVCSPCKRRDEAAKAAPRGVIKLKLHPSASGSTGNARSAEEPAQDAPAPKAPAVNANSPSGEAQSIGSRDLTSPLQGQPSPLPSSAAAHVKPAAPVAPLTTPTLYDGGQEQTSVSAVYVLPLKQEWAPEHPKATKTAPAPSAIGSRASPPRERNGIARASNGDIKPEPAAGPTDSARKPEPILLGSSTGPNRSPSAVTNAVVETKATGHSIPALSVGQQPEGMISLVAEPAGPAIQPNEEDVAYAMSIVVDWDRRKHGTTAPAMREDSLVPFTISAPNLTKGPG